MELTYLFQRKCDIHLYYVHTSFSIFLCSHTRQKSLDPSSTMCIFTGWLTHLVLNMSSLLGSLQHHVTLTICKGHVMGITRPKGCFMPLVPYSMCQLTKLKWRKAKENWLEECIGYFSNFHCERKEQDRQHSKILD